MEKIMRRMFLFSVIFLLMFGFRANAQYTGYIYFVKNNNIWVNDLSTGTSTQITRLEISIGTGALSYLSISSDGTKIIFSYKANTSTETQIYSVNYDGSGLENLSFSNSLNLQTKNQISGCLSSDMTKLAFSAEMRNPGPYTGRQLWLKELTGLKRLFQLTLMNGDVSDVQFLDDNHIVFKHQLGYLEDYYMISTDGSDLTNLTNYGAFEPYFPRLGRPSLNQNRSSMVYANQTQDSGGYSNWKISQYDIQAGSSIDVITNLYYSESPSAQRDPQPIIITDSNGVDTAIVFAGKSPFSSDYSLYLVPSGSTSPYGLSISNSSGASYPVFCPTKARPVKFVYTSGTPSQVYLVDAGKVSQLTSTVSNNYDPVFDSTGSLVAYAGNGIWVMKADGTDPVQIDSTFNARYPAFSPDTKWVAYVKSGDIYARKIDLTISPIKLTNSSSVEKSDLCFSPDGSSIVYTGTTSNGRQIFSLPVKITANNIAVTGLPVNLTQTPGSENFQPSFSLDGKKIIFISTRSGSPTIFVMNSDGSGQYQLLSNFASYPQFSPWDSDNRITFNSQSVKIANLDTATVVDVNPSITPSQKFSWAKSIPEKVKVTRQFVYNRVDKDLAYYYCLNISVNRLNPPQSFILTEELPEITKGASADWKITDAWFNDTQLFPLTSSGNTTGIVKWIVSNNIGSIFPLTDGTLKLKIEFQGTPVEGTWNFINGNITDGTIRTTISGDSYIVYGEPDFPADTDGNGKISDAELLYTIERWASNLTIHGFPMDLSQWDFWLLKTIDFWAKGGYIFAPISGEYNWNRI